MSGLPTGSSVAALVLVLGVAPLMPALAARTVARMVELINGLEGNDTNTRNKFSRCVQVKEQHAEKVKREVQVIWSDYFKPEHLEAHPDLHDAFWQATKQASKVKQTLDVQAAKDLLAAIDRIDAMWKSTGGPEKTRVH